jgi:hypothetical protein
MGTTMADAHQATDPGWEQTQQQMHEVQEILEHLTVDFFVEGIENACHFPNEAGQALADAAVLVAKAAEVVDWLGSALRWLGHIVPGVGLLGDAVHKVGDVSKEKALEASFHAIGISGSSMELAAVGWDARGAGHVTKAMYERVYHVGNEVYHTSGSILAVLFD